MLLGVTENQERILRAIRWFKRTHAKDPNLKEISEAALYSSRAGAQGAVDRLVRKGFIVKLGKINKRTRRKHTRKNKRQLNGYQLTKKGEHFLDVMPLRREAERQRQEFNKAYPLDDPEGLLLDGDRFEE